MHLSSGMRKNQITLIIFECQPTGALKEVDLTVKTAMCRKH
jgi:hypothetical protein